MDPHHAKSHEVVDPVSTENEPSEQTVNNWIKFFGFVTVLIGIFIFVILIINPILLIVHYKKKQDDNTLTTDENNYLNIAIDSLFILCVSIIISFFWSHHPTTFSIAFYISMFLKFIYVILTIIVCEKLRNLDNTNDQSYKVFPIIFYIILGIFCLIFLYIFMFGKKHNKIAAE
jgi:uncharacterized Tic20 family protein